MDHQPDHLVNAVFRGRFMAVKIWNWLRDQDNRDALRFLGILAITVPTAAITTFNWLTSSDKNAREIAAAPSQEIQTRLMSWTEYRDNHLVKFSTLGFVLYEHEATGTEFRGENETYLQKVDRRAQRLTKGDSWEDRYQVVELVDVRPDSVDLKLTDTKALIDQLSACCGYDGPENSNPEQLSVAVGGGVPIDQGYEGGQKTLYIAEIIGLEAVRFEVFFYGYPDSSFSILKELAKEDGIELSESRF